MEVLGALIGVGVIAISPLVPGLRPVAKTAIKGGMAVVDMSKGAAAVAVHQWGQVVAEASAEAEEIEQRTRPWGSQRMSPLQAKRLQRKRRPRPQREFFLLMPLRWKALKSRRNRLSRSRARSSPRK